MRDLAALLAMELTDEVIDRSTTVPGPQVTIPTQVSDVEIDETERTENQ